MRKFHIVSFSDIMYLLTVYGRLSYAPFHASPKGENPDS